MKLNLKIILLIGFYDIVKYSRMVLFWLKQFTVVRMPTRKLNYCNFQIEVRS